jgi:hypothetical protein
VRRTVPENRSLIAMACFLVLASAPAAISTEYMPMEPGIHWSYTPDVEADVGTPDTIEGTMATPLTLQWPAGFEAILWGLYVPGSWWLVVRMGATPAQAWLWGALCYAIIALVLYLRFRAGTWQGMKIFGEERGVGH